MTISTLTPDGCTFQQNQREKQVRVGYGPLAWIRQSLAPKRASARVPSTNFNLLNRLPVIREGRLIRLGNLSMGQFRDQQIWLVLKSCYAMVFHDEGMSRRRTLDVINTTPGEEIILPDRVLVLRGGSASRIANVKEDLELKCSDGSTLTLRAANQHERDAWIAAMDRAVRQGATQLSDFETYAKLARGHFGTVQLVKHIRTGTALALKQIEMRPQVDFSLLFLPFLLGFAYHPPLLISFFCGKHTTLMF